MAPLLPPAPWLWCIGLPVVLGLLAWALRLVRRSAVWAGVPLGLLVLRFGGLAGFLVLAWFFLLGTALTRLGYSSKAALGVAEGAGGRRGASHVLANCGMGLILLGVRAVMASAGMGLRLESVLWAAFVGSFATAASDTSSSEIGQLLGRTPVSLRSFRVVPVGTEGAVSLEGLVAGFLASASLGGLGWALGVLHGPAAFAAVALGGFLGNLVESLVGGWGKRALPHGWLNFANTAVGALLSALGVAWM